MRQQVPDGNAILPVALEAGDVGRDAIGKPQLSVFNQLHHRGRRGDDLGERGEIEDRVERHRLDRRPKGTVPHRLAVHHAIADSRDDHRAGKLAIGNRLRHQRLDQRQAVGR